MSRKNDSEIEHATQKNNGIDNFLVFQKELIEGMATLVESRDLTTGEHVQNTRVYVTMIVEKLVESKDYPDVTPEYAQNVCIASMLHDIGKIFISDILLNKPGKLTPGEFELIKTHTVLGGEIVDELFAERLDEETVSVIRDIVLYHHEKWDGSGYPEGLKKEEIPLAARIVTVADVFDALVSNRAYKTVYPLDRAYEILSHDSGSHFDKAIVDVFISLRPQVEEYLKNQRTVKNRKILFSQFGDFEKTIQRESIIKGLAGDFEAVFYADPDNDRITVIRQDENSMFYAPDKEEMSMTFSDFISGTLPYIHPDQAKIFTKMVDRKTIREQFRGGDVLFLTFRNLYKNKDEYYEMKLIRLGKADDEHFDVLIGIHNINGSELVKLEEKNKLMEAKEQAERAASQKTEFVYKVSHDLRAPLNDIIGFTDISLRHLDDKERLNSYISKMKLSGEAMLTIINRLLEIESAEYGVNTFKEATGNSCADTTSNRALKGKRILLVEDNDLKREIEENILIECGAELKSAKNGEEALSVLTSSPKGYFDVILMDMQMPVMDGIEATRRIRASENKDISEIPIIAMTASAFEHDKKIASNVGTNAFLSKPIEIPILVNTVCELTEKTDTVPIFNSDAVSYTILKSANIGLWAIELEEGSEPRMYADETMMRLLGVAAPLSPEETYLAWYERIHPGFLEDVTEAVEKMTGGSHAEVQYPWFHPQKGLRYVRCGGIRNYSFTNGVRMEGCHQDITEMTRIHCFDDIRTP